ncbi:hypothetical protein BDZ89DRAFT_1056561 [Hymenopellis radicata]|nr:hypothetical protein BDZ89DRAFT_1056561 [Hymenopellis radicata]
MYVRLLSTRVHTPLRAIHTQDNGGELFPKARSTRRPPISPPYLLVPIWTSHDRRVQTSQAQHVHGGLI